MNSEPDEVEPIDENATDQIADDAQAPRRPAGSERTDPKLSPRSPGYGRRLWRLFLAFVRVGSFGFGGGPSMIPLVRIEAVKTNRWLSDEEFMEIYAVASSLPGPISTNMAGYFGWRVAGLAGSLAALFGLTLPSGIAIVLLGGLYQATKDSSLVQDALAGVRPVVIALLLGVAIAFAPKALASLRGATGRALRVTLVVAAFLVAAFTPVHPALLIVAGAAVGLGLRRAW